MVRDYATFRCVNVKLDIANKIVKMQMTTNQVLMEIFIFGYVIVVALIVFAIYIYGTPSEKMPREYFFSTKAEKVKARIIAEKLKKKKKKQRKEMEI